MVRRFLGIAFLIAALAQLGVRGMQRVRHDIPLWDFVSVYSASRTWIHGEDPYDLTNVIATWHTSGMWSDRDVSYFATVYPPTSLVIIAPFAVLPAGPAMIIWLILTIVLLGLMFAALADMAGLTWRDGRILLLVGAALAAAPLQFGILAGQLSLPAISACIIAFWLVSRHHDGSAGVLLGLALALKPQIAAPFVVYYLLVRHFKVAGFAALVGGGIGVLSLLLMHTSHVDWVAGMRHSIALTEQLGAVNDYGWTNRFRDEMVDLRLPLISILHDANALRLAVGVIVAALLAWYFWLILRTGERSELLALAGLSAIALLATYHRVYDVTLLTTAFAWALAELDGQWRRYALLLLIPMIVFLVPFDIVLTAGRRMPHLVSMSKTGWWQSLIAPLYALGLFATALGLLLTMSLMRRRESISVRLASLASQPLTVAANRLRP
ncbi:MAG TPA: glycosyltransferase family 87 protein [Tepidisphaeraceae bacterium]|jgi:hypothetical protein